jgi:hypothetical protein
VKAHKAFFSEEKKQKTFMFCTVFAAGNDTAGGWVSEA